LNSSNSNINLENYIICIQSKLTKNISKAPSTKVNNYLDLLYIDIGGPIKPLTYKGYKYYITFKDSATKYLEVELLKSRKNIVEVIKKVITRVELQSKDSNKVKSLQLDNEFKSKDLTNYLVSKGIITRFSAPYTSEQNGAAEIVNRILFNKVRALLINSNLPKKLWGEAILSATYLYNRTPSSTIKYKTPFELVYKEQPNLEHIKIWGSLVLNKKPNQFISKLDAKSYSYYLIGYNSNQYKLFNPLTNKIVYSRDYKVLEGYYYNPSNPLKSIFKEIDYKDITNKELVISNKSNRAKRPIIIEDSELDELQDPRFNTTSINNTININKSLLYNNLLFYNILYTSKTLLEPKSYKEVLLLENKDKNNYLKAIELEIDNLIKNNT
jgi:hypothetical protein